MSDKNDIQKKIETDEDFIRSPKYGNSLSKFLAKNSDGVEDSVIARLLAMPEEEVVKVYEEAVAQLRSEMADDE